MLKALELYGFKSFADKTRFEFPPGITVVVGPNGSGKSNIVDGIKWVLGEQSAKSLRGKEMADVIFKGSGGASSARRPANAAEVTIVFDNTSGLLPLDTEEVRVTRRVYRSGEGEYQINGNACRLRDVRDLFRGTGMGTDAYSLIEQGKVDTLLQASPRDRRAIFEEAAGISRFKAKKVETQRRLERVEQNLQRLSDIVEEVESQLRSVRNQASKARRFKEYNDRLRELRTHVGLADWRRFTEELVELEGRLGATQTQRDTLQRLTAEHEQTLAALDSHLTERDATVRQIEANSSQVQQELTGHLSTITYEHQRIDELAHEIQRFRRQWLAMNARAGDVGQQLREVQQQLESADSEDRVIRARLDQQQGTLKQTETALAEYRRQRDQQREELAHQQRVANDLSRRIGGLESELETLDQQIERTAAQRAELTEQLETARGDHEREAAREEELQAREQAARAALNNARSSLQANERQLSELQQQAVDLQRQFTGARERANVLQDLERRSEGLSAGVKDLLRQAQDAPLGALATVRGMVADLIRVDVRMAPMIDATLGDLTQYVVIDGNALIEQIAAGEIQLKGRVGLLDLHVPGLDSTIEPRVDGDRTVLGRADEFVESEAIYDKLVRHLLGDCFCVETLQDALRLRPRADSAVRFVTRAGEILESNGRVLAGPRQAALGLVSRRSELRSLQHQIAELEPELQRTETRIRELRGEISSSEAQVDERTSEYDEVSSELMNARVTSRAAADRVATLETQLEQRQQDEALTTERRHAADQQRIAQGEKLEQATAQVAKLEQSLAEQDARLAESETQRQQQLAQVTEVKVELAKSEQRIDSLRGQLVRHEEDQRERERARQEVHGQLERAKSRHQSAERAILQANSAVALLYLRAETLQRELLDAHRGRAQEAESRREIQHRCDQARKELQRQDEARHRLELDINRIRMERETLVQRVRDDYDIELSELGDLALESEDEQRQREEIDREINELRRRLSNIGAVNMAALDEIEALEQRHGALANQYQDLVDAKDALARIIHKINADSRRLFTESLETIRTNFQALFRRVFGGGQADIVLEEGVDILEAGIDIVATPPGKHSLGISLLSGGERALTAVTLLLAIFQYRPSPFCVLDEVDGPLDEANIGRFVDVLREFLEWTKFVVVTHSKKTMTAANTLYGVTMQESGVSKRVSVQFEDVSEDGHIRPEALQRDNSGSQADPGNSPNSPDDDERGAA